MRGLVAKRALIIISVLTGLLLASSAIAGGVPKWVTKAPEDKEYLYFAGIKTGASALEDGKRSAINQAVTELVEHFEVRSKTRYYEKKTEIETMLLDEIESRSVDTRLKGMLLKDWYYEKTERGFDVYVLVQYPKAELEKEKQRAQNVLAEKTLSVRRLLKGGVDARSRGDVKAAYHAFADAIREADEIEDEGLRKEALGRLRDLLQGIEIEAISGAGQRPEAFKRLKEPLVAKVFIRNGGAEVPVTGLPVLFKISGDEDKGDVVFTDGKGFASYQEIKIKATSGPFVVIASPEPVGSLPQAIIPKSDMEAIDSYIEALGQKRAVFSLNPVIVKKNIRVSVSITSENSGDESIVVEAISSGLSDAGYEVVAIDDDTGTDIIVTGLIGPRKGSGNMGWAYSSHADGFIKAVDRSTGKVLAQKNLTAIGFGETEALAEVNALRKLGEEITGQLIERMAEGDD